ncbi:hypothetical protein RF644_14870 [Kocuria sp. CPCC 205258]|uniref:hypothetical protein n=1 Tax=Kocuria sp. CPCC 205258 TaxID=3073552 RepID=UPI0034D74F05
MAEETEVTIDQAASTGANQVSAIPAPKALPPTPAPPQVGPVQLRVPELTAEPAAEDETASIAAATTGARAGLATAAGQAQAGMEQLPTGQEIGPAAAVASAPDIPAGPLTAATTPAPITPPVAPAMEQAASALMNEAYGPTLRQEGAAASAAAATLLGQHRQAVEQELSQTTTSLAQAQQDTLGAQQAERTAAAQAVAARKATWRTEQAAATDDYAQQATAEQGAVSVEVTATMAAARQAAQAEVTAVTREGPPVQQVPVQRSWWDRAKNAVSSGVSAIGRGARSVGAAASRLYDAARTRASALLDAARNAVRIRVGAFLGAVRGALGKAVARISAATSAARTWIQSRVSAGINRLTALARSLSDRALALARRCRVAVGRFVSVLKSGIAKIGAKIGAVARRIWNAGKVLWQIAKVLKDGAVKAFVMLIEAPGQALEYIRDVVAGLVAKAPDKMQSVLAQYVAPRLRQAPAAGGPAVVQRQQASAEARADPALQTRWAAVWRHLTVRYDYVKANWWQVIKDAALEVLVPGVALYRHVPTLVKELGAGFTAMLAGDYSVGFDHLLASARSLMAIVASFTAQVSIAAFIIGSIIGTPIVGVAALETIGIAILVADASLQLVSLAHALDNLDRRRTPEQHENDYGLIADSSIALVLLGLLALLGAIASSAVNSLLRRFPALVTAAESLRTRIRSRLGRGAGVPESPTPQQLRDVEAGINRVPAASGHPVRARLSPEQQLAFDRWIAERIEEGFNAGKSPAEINAGIDAALANKDPAAVANMLKRQLKEVKEQQARALQAEELRKGDPLNPSAKHGPVDQGDNVSIRYNKERPTPKEIAEAKQLAAKTGEHIELFGDSYQGIDGTIGTPPRPLQLKGYTTTDPAEIVRMAQKAQLNAQGAPYTRVEVSIDAPGITKAQAREAFSAVDPKTVTDGTTVSRVRVWCKNNEVYEPTSFAPKPVPIHPPLEDENRSLTTIPATTPGAAHR